MAEIVERAPSFSSILGRDPSFSSFVERDLSFSSLNHLFPTFPHRPSSASATIMTMGSPDHPSGASTPPLQPSATVPFRWEQEPGKPRPETGAAARLEHARCLDPPPCRNAVTKTPSPSSTLDGPYNAGRASFSSFRYLFRDGPDSFGGAGTGTGNGTPRTGGGKKGRGRGLFGKFRGGRREVEGGNFGFSSFSSSSCDSDDGGRRLRRNASFSTASHANKSSSHIWATIYGGLKQVVHRKSSR